MTAKELLELNQYMVAFNAIARGDLAKELKAAQDAIDALGGAQALAGAQATLDTDKAAFEVYKATINDSLVSAEEAIAIAHSKLDTREISVAAQEEVIRQAKNDLAQAQGELSNQQEAFVAQTLKQAAELQAARDDVNADKTALDAAFAGIASRELAVSQKLAAMKAIV